jgi:hypothetical protein
VGMLAFTTPSVSFYLMRRMPHQREEAKRIRAECDSFMEGVMRRMPHQREEAKRIRAECDSFFEEGKRKNKKNCFTTIFFYEVL